MFVGTVAEEGYKPQEKARCTFHPEATAVEV